MEVLYTFVSFISTENYNLSAKAKSDKLTSNKMNYKLINFKSSSRIYAQMLFYLPENSPPQLFLSTNPIQNSSLEVPARVELQYVRESRRGSFYCILKKGQRR